MGDCHYLYGNHMTIKRIRFLQELLEFVGLGERVHLEWISSAEARKFVEVTTAFTEKIRSLGPSPLSIEGPLLSACHNLSMAEEPAFSKPVGASNGAVPGRNPCGV